MIDIEFINNDIKKLLSGDRCIAFDELAKKKNFLRAVLAFLYMLKILDNTAELLVYQCWNYKKGNNHSSVLFREQGIEGYLLFIEQDNGTKIRINNLIWSNDGKERKF